MHHHAAPVRRNTPRLLRGAPDGAADGGGAYQRGIPEGNAGAPAAAFLSVVRKRPPGLALLAKTRGLLEDS
jgi:hypothetical protein